METFTVRDLRDRTGELIRGAEQGHLAIVTKHGQPVFVAVPFDEALIRLGINVRLAVQLYAEEVVSLGQAAKVAGMAQERFMEVLGREGIPVVRYSTDDLERELGMVAEHDRGG